MAEERLSLVILGVIAIIAVIGLVLLFRGGGATGAVPQETPSGLAEHFPDQAKAVPPFFRNRGICGDCSVAVCDEKFGGDTCQTGGGQNGICTEVAKCSPDFDDIKCICKTSGGRLPPP